MDTRIEKLEHDVLRLTAEVSALVSMLKDSYPDARPLLGIHRWPEFQKLIRDQCAKLGLEDSASDATAS